jgi:hypothetical protein
MSFERSTRTAIVLVVALAGITALYWGPLETRFLNDDYLFLEQARTRPFLSSLTQLGTLENHYRPLSRQTYFAALTPLAGDSPLVFHLVNYGLFLAALALLADLLRSLLPFPGVVAGVLYFALLPLQRVNLTWVSCGQDLLALTGTLAAFALWRRGRQGWALLPSAMAFASKESALPLPLALLAWELWVAPGPDRARPVLSRLAKALRRVAPVLVLALAWTALSVTLRAQHGSNAPLVFAADSFAAGYAHLVQALLGVENPRDWIPAMLANGPSIVALLLLAPLAFVGSHGTDSAGRTLAEGSSRDDRHGALAFGVAWLLAFGLVVGPVAYSWSAYYYTLAAVGGAVLVGLLLRRARTPALLGLLFVMLWVHAGTSAVPAFSAFSVSRSPWDWTSQLTSFYFERAASLTDSLSRQLVRIDPNPPRDARMFFSNLPSFAGFQMGNGALVRALYHAPTIQSYFYSQFSDSTAGDHPVYFYYWNGERLEPLYRNAREPFFQVGSDLLLLGRLDGAAHAFRRGLNRGESPKDNLYWLGWTELWRGRRGEAETLWGGYGARDDSLRWLAHMDAAYRMLLARDTLEARRHLITAIAYGIGRPEAHGILGGLLVNVHPRFGLLELEIANRLDPSDAATRRLRVLGLEQLHLEEPARRELEILKPQYPEWRSDSALAAAAARLEGRPALGAVPRY